MSKATKIAREDRAYYASFTNLRFKRCSVCPGQGMDGTGCVGANSCTICGGVMCTGHAADCSLGASVVEPSHVMLNRLTQ